jgi:unsaturated rhamnogalacturonyl hydrolase
MIESGKLALFSLFLCACGNVPTERIGHVDGPPPPPASVLDDAAPPPAIELADGASPAGIDWGKAVVESTMARYPTPAALGRWEYSRALFLHGAYLVYRRLHDPRYLAYIKAWVDTFVAPDGTINNAFNSLDNMMPGNLLLDLYQETSDPRYQTAAAKIRKRLDTYPRTTMDGPLGGFWHNTGLHGQLWADGTFMALPFLARYGQLFADAAYADDEVARQLLIYGGHLHNPATGLLFHAYAELGNTSWADPITHHSPESWCRAVGWYGMTMVMVLDILPASHPERPQLLAALQTLVDAFANFQDPQTGRWFQVVDKGSLPNNWTEASCSSMYTYVLSRSVQRGYVAAKYAATATKGYDGVLAKIALGADGRTNISDICPGTNVGNLAFYLARPRVTNDFHGLGSFLIMYEQVNGH